jgi:hypothetical protein
MMRNGEAAGERGKGKGDNGLMFVALEFELNRASQSPESD